MRSYAKSEAQLARAEAVIPLGSQTFSKSRTQYPVGVSPLYLQRGQGARVWDLDGNDYIDFISGLASITLGYGDPDVDAAVRAQLDEGVILSLPHPIEADVAELLVEMVPCAEKVRFSKNGSDATAGAIRVARAFTGRDRVAVCGYHGWQDWYIGTTARNRGVPEATRQLSHAFHYNDASSLHALLRQYPGEFAAVILEPMNVVEPLPGFLAEVQTLAKAHGALLVFDETITGFRFSLGGAQQLFGVTPDLATFGKGMANGHPVSAVTGRGDVMALMEEVFFSFTFGGEMLSLAAAKATMMKMRREPVIETLLSRGQDVKDGIARLIAVHGVSDFLSLGGHPSWSFLLIGDAAPYTSWQLKTFYMQEMFESGILAYGSHTMSYAHSDEDVGSLLAAYDRLFPLLRRVVDEGSLDTHLRCAPLQPLFRVR